MKKAESKGKKDRYLRKNSILCKKVMQQEMSGLQGKQLILPVEKGCKHWKDKEYGRYCLCVTFMQRKKEHHKKTL